jgi:hypothetical protein
MSAHQQIWQPPRKPSFDGASFDPAADGARLNRQLRAVFDAMRDGHWHTPEEIATKTGVGWASASARLRDLRKQKFGGFQIDRQRTGDAAKGLFRYRLRPPAPEQRDLFASIDGETPA